MTAISDLSDQLEKQLRSRRSTATRVFTKPIFRLGLVEKVSLSRLKLEMNGDDEDMRMEIYQTSLTTQRQLFGSKQLGEQV